MTLSSLLKKTLLTAIGLPALALAAEGERVGDFSLLDQDGYFHQMSWYDDNKAIALLVQANGDAAVRSAMPDFTALRDRYGSQGIEFFMINPMGLKNRDAVKAELADLDIAMPVLMDDARLISEALGISKTSEVLLYDPASFTVVFRGPIGAELTQSLDALVAGNALQVAQVMSSGTAIHFPVREAHRQNVPSYEKEIGPIVAENCATCHRAGGIAPFALDSHTMVKGWSQMIREVLMTKRMPP